MTMNKPTNIPMTQEEMDRRICENMLKVLNVIDAMDFLKNSDDVYVNVRLLCEECGYMLDSEDGEEYVLLSSGSADQWRRFVGDGTEFDGRLKLELMDFFGGLEVWIVDNGKEVFDDTTNAMLDRLEAANVKIHW